MRICIVAIYQPESCKAFVVIFFFVKYNHGKGDKSMNIASWMYMPTLDVITCSE